MTFNPNAGAVNCQGLITDARHVLVGNSTTTYTSAFNAVAQFVVVAWESSDLSSFSPLSAPLLQLAASASSKDPGSPFPNTALTNGNIATPSNGLAQSTKIGLGVGIACGVMLVCAAVGLLIYRRRLRRLRSTSGTVRTTEDQIVAGVVTKAELGGDSYVHEIGGKQVVAEADNMHARHELEGG
jgi:hypothetical protein